MNFKTKFKQTLSSIGRTSRRLNQIILAFPIWIILQMSGIFKNSENNEGWIKSEENKRHEKMY